MSDVTDDPPGLTERLANELADGTADMERAATLPGIPSPKEELKALASSVRALKTVVDTLTGVGGSVLDKAITAREMLNESILVFDPMTGLATGIPTIVTEAGGDFTVPEDEFEDPRPYLTTPPTPTALEANASFRSVVLSWNLLDFRNYAYTEVLRHSSNNVALATVQGTSTSRQYVDNNVAYGTTYYYWVRAVGYISGTGATVVGAESNVASDTTGYDIPGLLDGLTGEITESQLFASLGERINQVNADAGMATKLFWGFDTSTNGWTATNADLASAGGGTVTWTPTATGPTLAPASFTAEQQFVGSVATKVRARVKRLSGTGVWEGNCFYTTALHASTGLYVKTIPAPANPDVWNVLEWDMSALTAGGTDWVDSTILRIRLDLVTGNSPASSWAIDWIAIGETSVTPLSVAIAQEQSIRQNETGDLFAQYTVKIDTNGYVSGFGLASEAAVDATPTSTFAVRADQFYIASPSGPGVPPFVPFIVRTTSGAWGPAGVYIKLALIEDGQITSAKIGSLAADKITAGYTTSVDLESSTFVGSQFYIGGTVTYEFADLANPTKKTGIASVANPAVSLNASGATFRVDSFRIQNNVGVENPFELVGGLVKIKTANIGTVNAGQINANGLSIYTPGGALLLDAGGSDYLGKLNGVTGSTITSAVTNFNAGNDQNGAAVPAVTFAVDAITHSVNADGSVNLSAAWVWGGDEEDIDGFEVFLRRSTSATPAVLSETSPVVTAFVVPAVKRSMIFTGVAATSNYYVAVRAYRRVNQSVNANGIIRGTLVQFPDAAVAPYQPSTSVAFTGDLSGSLGGTAVTTVVTGAANGTTALNAINDATTGLNARLRNNANQVLGGIISVNTVAAPAGFRAGTINWNAAGARTSGSGVAMTPLGLVAYSGATPTFVLDATTGDATFAGTLDAADGTFAGSLSAATGTFSGTLTAAAVNAVNTLNIAGEAVTIPRFSFAPGPSASVTIVVPSGKGGATVAIVGSISVPRSGYGQYVVVDSTPGGSTTLRNESVVGGSIPAMNAATTLGAGTHVISVYSDDGTAFNAFVYAQYTMK